MTCKKNYFRVRLSKQRISNGQLENNIKNYKVYEFKNFQHRPNFNLRFFQPYFFNLNSFLTRNWFDILFFLSPFFFKIIFSIAIKNKERWLLAKKNQNVSTIFLKKKD